MVSMLKALWGRWFGGGGTAEREDSAAATVEYKGYRIRPTPYPVREQYQTAGIIEKDFAAGVKTHRFVRAETHPTMDDAAAFAVMKGKQIIDQQGDRIFEGQ
jgi:hypothetical protein